MSYLFSVLGVKPLQSSFRQWLFAVSLALLISSAAFFLFKSSAPRKRHRWAASHSFLRVNASLDAWSVEGACPNLHETIILHLRLHLSQNDSAVVYGRKGGGWGDRLPSMVSAFAFALRYQRRFFIDYPALSHWMYSPYFDWALTEETQPSLFASIRNDNPLVLYSCEERCLWASSRPNDRFPPHLPFLHIVTNRGLWSPPTLPEHLDYFNNMTEQAPACLHQSLFRPRKALLDLANPYLVRFSQARAAGARVVGIHYRVGDASMSSADKSEATLDGIDDAFRVSVLACAAANDTRIFFASDSSRLRLDVKSRFGSKVILTDIHARHIGDAELRDMGFDEREVLGEALVEWWLLAQSDMMLFSPNSGFARTAVAASSHGAYMLPGSFRCRPDFAGHKYPSWKPLFKNSGL